MKKGTLIQLICGVLVAAIGAYSAITVTRIQTSSVSITGLAKVNEAMYQDHITKIQDKINELKEENASLRERIAKLEGANEARLAHRVHRAVSKEKTILDALKAYVADDGVKKLKLEKVNVQKVLEE